MQDVIQPLQEAQLITQEVQPVSVDPKAALRRQKGIAKKDRSDERFRQKRMAQAEDQEEAKVYPESKSSRPVTRQQTKKKAKGGGWQQTVSWRDEKAGEYFSDGSEDFGMPAETYQGLKIIMDTLRNE